MVQTHWGDLVKPISEQENVFFSSYIDLKTDVSYLNICIKTSSTSVQSGPKVIQKMGNG